MIKNKRQMFIVVGVFTLVMLLGSVTYAFFNYTRTGTSNTIRTGNITFTTSQETISLTNAFPISSTDALTDTDNVGAATITITGNTDYSGGIEYLVSVDEVYDELNWGESNAKYVPISLILIPEETGDLGEDATNYFSQRGGNTSYYEIFYDYDNGIFGDLIADYYDLNNNHKLLAGYIAPGSNGINGTIGIKAYLDKDKVAISDTYTSSNIEKTYYVVNDNLTEEQLDECVSYLSSLSATESFCQGIGTITKWGSNYTFQEALNQGYIINNTQIGHLINEGIISESHTDGTINDWRNSRMILTTSEWNSLQENPLSFKVKVEANEGIWLENILEFTNFFGIEQTSQSGADFVTTIANGIQKYRFETSFSIETDVETGNDYIAWNDRKLYDSQGQDVTSSVIFEKIVFNLRPERFNNSFDSQVRLEFVYDNGSYIPPDNFTPELAHAILN